MTYFHGKITEAQAFFSMDLRADYRPISIMRPHGANVYVDVYNRLPFRWETQVDNFYNSIITNPQLTFALVKDEDYTTTRSRLLEQVKNRTTEATGVLVFQYEVEDDDTRETTSKRDKFLFTNYMVSTNVRRTVFKLLPDSVKRDDA